jgi:hypothetical protein
VIGIVISYLPRLQAPDTTTQAQLMAGIFAIYGVTVLSFFLVMLIGAFAIYYFLDRRNKHFKRQHVLFTAISQYFQSRSTAISENAGKLAQLSEESVFEENDRPAGLWAILHVFVTPIVSLVVAYNLAQDLRQHEQRQLEYQATLASAIEEAGFPRPTPASPRTHNRDPMVYLIVSLITAGLFWIYWFYTLLRDYNEHFEDQARLEDVIIASLKPSLTCKNCGGSVPHGAKFCPLCGAAIPAT